MYRSGAARLSSITSLLDGRRRVRSAPSRRSALRAPPMRPRARAAARRTGRSAAFSCMPSHGTAGSNRRAPTIRAHRSRRRGSWPIRPSIKSSTVPDDRSAPTRRARTGDPAGSDRVTSRKTGPGSSSGSLRSTSRVLAVPAATARTLRVSLDLLSAVWSGRTSRLRAFTSHRPDVEPAQRSILWRLPPAAALPRGGGRGFPRPWSPHSSDR